MVSQRMASAFFVTVIALRRDWAESHFYAHCEQKTCVLTTIHAALESLKAE